MPYKFNPFTGTFDDSTTGPQGATGTVSAAGSGTAAAPGIAFASDTNTGIYSPGADQVAISTNGTGRLFIDAAGLVGIGTSAPSKKFEVANGDVRLSDGYTLSWGDDAWRIFRNGSQLRFDANGTQALTIDSSQRVGIGTTSPTQKLHVDGNILLSGTGYLGFGGDVNYIEGDSGSNVVKFGTNNVERARLTSSGQLLVGTSTAVGTDGIQLKGPAGGNASLKLLGGNTGSLSVNSTIAQINFSDGYWGGTGASINAVADAAQGNGDYPTRLEFSTTADGAAIPAERMRIGSSGMISLYTGGNDAGAAGGINFEVDTGSVRANWYNVAGETRSVQYFYYGGAEKGSIVVSSTATAYVTSSDYRLKESVTAITDGITRLQQLKPSRFNFISNPDKTVDGFLAHEAQTIVPECVTGTKDEVDDDGNPVYQGIDQAKLVPLLTAALQEAIAKIETLEARLTAAGI